MHFHNNLMFNNNYYRVQTSRRTIFLYWQEFISVITTIIIFFAVYVFDGGREDPTIKCPCSIVTVLTPHFVLLSSIVRERVRNNRASEFLGSRF